jgi:hypothetical protein
VRGQPLTTTLPKEDHDYIVGLAKALGQSVSSVLARIVREHIQAEEALLTRKAK